MSKHLFRRSLGFMLSAMLTLSALPVTALAAKTENAAFQTIELVATDVELDETIFEYTGSEIIPNVTVRTEDKLLTLNEHYSLTFENNIEAGEAKVIVTGIATGGYTGTVEHPFFINEKSAEYVLVTIQDENVTINGTEFAYTGQPIEPAVTVTIDGKTLTPEQDYAIEYINNLTPGTGTAIVRGIATASETLGYTGEVRRDFTILEIPEEDTPEDDTLETEAPETPEEEPEQDPQSPVEITASHVKLEQDSFLHTGSAIEPAVTVTVDGKLLTAGTDYGVKYENNTEVGTASVIISGIADSGYTGTVTVCFTIEPRYAITKGDGSIWNQNSGETLTFAVNGSYSDFDYLTVDGKTVPTKYYSVKSDSGMVLILKNSFLKLLDVDTYEIVFHFTDGKAEGTFKVSPEADDSNPKTGDQFPLHLLSAVMFVSLTGMLGAAYVSCRKLRK